MCFSLQRRAIFQHRNVNTWSVPLSFLTFWLENVLLATAACNFSRSQLQKVIRARQFFNILTLRCAFRNSAVQFFDIATSKRGPPLRCMFCTFWLENVLLATAACNFSTSQLPKVVRTCSERHILIENVLLATAACNFSTSLLQKVVRACSVLYILTSKCASRYSGVQFFMSPLSYLRTRRFTEVTFRPSRHTNHWKTHHFATSLTFRACVSSFYWLSRDGIFFLLTLLLFSAFSSSDSATLLCCSAFSTVHIVGS